MVWEFVRELLRQRMVRYGDSPDDEVAITDDLRKYNLDDDDLREIAVLLSGEFRVEIADEEISGWETVEDIVAGVGDKL
ncbi:MAG TPA: acyl carrier protein [Firmicutes bacterium]|nr:acyl carrier protein [Bacillota bacterium]